MATANLCLSKKLCILRNLSPNKEIGIFFDTFLVFDPFDFFFLIFLYFLQIDLIYLALKNRIL